MLDGILEGPWSDFLHKGGPAQGVTQPGLESLNAQMENAHGLGGEIKVPLFLLGRRSAAIWCASL